MDYEAMKNLPLSEGLKDIVTELTVHRALFDQHLAVIRELADNVKALTERLIQVNNRVIELERRNNKIVHYPHR